MTLGGKPSSNSLDYGYEDGVTVDVLIVSGGGGSGSVNNRSSGGAGGGGVIEDTRIVYGDCYVQVGAGGTGAPATAPAAAYGLEGSEGGPSRFDRMRPAGGGCSSTLDGQPGGSGGGGGFSTRARDGGSGLGTQGYPGGTSTSQFVAGAGGGAGGAGSGTSGGIGRVASWLPSAVRSVLGVGELSGSDTYFSGGGGTSGGSGGLGGGGDNNNNATALTGGGAGGRSVSQAVQAGFNGGSGCVVIRVPATADQPTFGAGLTVVSDTSNSDYYYYAFTAGADYVTFPQTSDNLAPVNPPIVDFLMVGGGGGGAQGSQGAGGGGAGAVRSGTSSGLTGYAPMTIAIGAGGATNFSGFGTTGGRTIYQSNQALGGGGGGDSAGAGKDGGSGGGGSGAGTNSGGSADNPSYGNPGGSSQGSTNADDVAGGGGGGAGGSGGNATTSSAGDGGIGVISTIISAANATALGVGEVSGSDVYFGGGGGGSRRTTTGGTAGDGGLGGGGNGSATAEGDSGAANTGGGAGGCRGLDVANPRSGGSGVIILRLNDSSYLPTIGAGLTYSTVTEGTDTVIVFTAGADQIVWE